MSPSIEARIAEYAAAPTPPSPPPSLLSPWSSPLPHIPLPPLPPLPSSPHLPPSVPTSLPLPSSPLLDSLFIPPPVDRREDIPEAELPPHKRLCPTAPISRYEVGESSTAVLRPTGGHGADYGFIGTVDAKEQDTQDIYSMIEDTQDMQTQIYQRDDILSKDRHSAVHYELQAYMTHTQMQDYHIVSQESLMTTLIAQVSSLQGQLSVALGQIQALQDRDQTHADDPEGAGSSA
ncbi:hypothetical protein Tco_0528712 [Tanacetum coccineum]